MCIGDNDDVDKDEVRSPPKMCGDTFSRRKCAVATTTTALAMSTCGMAENLANQVSIRTACSHAMCIPGKLCEIIAEMQAVFNYKFILQHTVFYRTTHNSILLSICVRMD